MRTKTAVITGATKGIGKAIAQKFLQAGFNIAICARNENLLATTLKEWQTEYPEQKIHAFRADLSSAIDCQDFYQSVMAQFPVIDVLVNNAGLYLPGTVLEENPENFTLQINTNVASAYHLSKAFGKGMQSHHSGHIINICSLASLQAYGGGSSYSISKYALLGLSDNFRAALQPFGVKVTAICPGPTMSASWEDSSIDEAQLMPNTDIAALVYQCSQMQPNTCIDRMVINTTKPF